VSNQKIRQKANESKARIERVNGKYRFLSDPHQKGVDFASKIASKRPEKPPRRPDAPEQLQLFPGLFGK
jgi:hypothetical protein